MQNLGIEAIATLLSSLGGVILAAVRTATIFYLSEKSLLDTYTTNSGEIFAWVKVLFPTVAMVSALFAVEGYLFSVGLHVGRSKRITTRGVPWGMVFSVGISIVAGVVASLPLVQSLAATSLLNVIFQWILVLMTGIGATILAYYGAENLGSIFMRWEILQLQVEEEYQAAIVVWNTKAQSSYTGRLGKRLFGIDNNSKNESGNRKGDVIEKEVVIEFLNTRNLSANNIGVGPEFIMKPSQIAEATGIKPENVRNILSRLRKGVNNNGQEIA